MGKLSETLSKWPSGTVAVQPWLDNQGVYRQLSKKYILGGWIKKIAHGAFIRAGDLVDWQGGIFAMQTELKLPLHVGGKSALELLGRAHFIPMAEQQELYIYTHNDQAEKYLPKWFASYFKNKLPRYISRKLFLGTEGLQELDCNTFNITISSVERALFEILALVPKSVSMQHAYLLFQDQDNLRVNLVQNLLDKCQSQLLCRLFLYLAKTCQLPIIEKINLKTANIGQGIRRVGDGSCYDQELKLYVPKVTIDEDMEF